MITPTEGETIQRHRSTVGESETLTTLHADAQGASFGTLRGSNQGPQKARKHQPAPGQAAFSWRDRLIDKNEKFLTILDHSRDECAALAYQTLKNPSTFHVHEFRRALRRFKTFLWLLPLPEEHSDLRKIQKALRKTHQLLGIHRTFEVALRDAKKYHLPTDWLEKKRDACHQKLCKKLPLLIDQEWAPLMSIPLEPLGPFSLLDSSEKISQALDRLHAQALCPPKKNTARHKLRLRVKKISILLDTIGSPLETLTNLQKTLGRWNDLVSLEELARGGDPVGFARGSALKALGEVRKERKNLWRHSKKILGDLTSDPRLFHENIKEHDFHQSREKSDHTSKGTHTSLSATRAHQGQELPARPTPAAHRPDVLHSEKLPPKARRRKPLQHASVQNAKVP